MNVIWSKYVQGTKTLYYSRKLRFNDLFAEQYRELFGLNEKRSLKILEIGCGPGALAGALHRWYPCAEIIAVDRDSEFISFGSENEPGVTFMEGDATSLPFDDNTFDVSTGFATIDLTPDNPKFSTSLAFDMINANRYTALDGIDSVLHTMPEHFTTQEVEEMKRLANAKYDTRIKQYQRGEKQWDTNVSIIMVIRGVK